MVELDRGVVSDFQKAWDEFLKDTKIFLIICGSSVGMMENEVLGYKSPLYGRRTGSWKVGPLKFADIKHFFPSYTFEELIKAWSVFGGTPYYLSLLNPSISVEENIKEKVLRKGEVLFNEPLILLREEFREPRTYLLILKYIALGYSSHGELSSATGIEKGNLSKYLSELEEALIVEYLLPLGQRKRGIYVIRDPFFNFWFRFVYPNVSDLELGLSEEVFSKISKELNSYYGIMFERLVFELLKSKEISLPFNPTEVKKWWHKGMEIDAVALNDETGEIAFVECKFGDNIDGERIAKELFEKTSFVKWKNEERKEFFIIFAKSFSKRCDEQEGRKVYCFDLKDLEKMLKNRNPML